MTETDRKKWLKDRLKGIGGSEASVVMGVNPWKSRLELYDEKVNGNVIEKDNPDLYWGRMLEPVIADEYHRRTGRSISICSLQLVSIKYPFMIANIDRLIIDERNQIGVLEIKTKSAYTKWENDEIPIYYQMQMQHYLSVTGHRYGSFVVMDLGKKDLLIQDVERDEELIGKLIEEESKFWNLVVSRTSPDPDNSKSCEQFLRKKYSTEIGGKTIDLRDNGIAYNAADLFDIVKEEIKKLEEKEQVYKNILMNIMKDNEVGIGNGYKITWKSPKDRILFDVDKFKNENPELYKKYIYKKKSTRRFTVRFDKES